MCKNIKTEIKAYLDIIPHRSRRVALSSEPGHNPTESSGIPGEAVITIPLREYEAMKGMIAPMQQQIAYLMQKVAELKHELSRYRALYGLLPKEIKD